MSEQIVELVRPTLWRTLVTNNTFRLAPWADVLYAADLKYWTHPQNADALKFGGLKTSIQDPAGGQHPEGILVLRNDGSQGYTDDPSAIRHGTNSGYQCVHLAAKLGAKRIILCGFDMRSIKNRQHWHDRHPAPLRDHSDGIYSGWIRSFEGLATELTKRGVEVFNATPGSKLTCFPMIELTEAVERWGRVSIKPTA